MDANIELDKKHQLTTLLVDGAPSAISRAMSLLAAGLGFDEDDLQYDISRENPKQYLGFSLDCVESEGGSEGDGEYVSRVYKISCQGSFETFYAKRTGFYQSHEGITWDDGYEIVYPHQVTVTKFYTVAELANL